MNNNKYIRKQGWINLKKIETDEKFWLLKTSVSPDNRFPKYIFVVYNAVWYDFILSMFGRHNYLFDTKLEFCYGQVIFEFLGEQGPVVSK